MSLKILSLPFVLGALSVASTFGSAGCKAGADDNGTGGTGSGTQANGTGTGATTGAGTSVGGNGPVSSSSGFGTVASSGGVGGGACAASSVQTALLPLDMVIVLDESGSMSGMKWDTVTAALKTFVQDPANAGISVGITYFPNHNADDCNYLDYENLNVDIGPLPANTPLLVASINGESPQGGTPTYGALKGALFKATAYQDAHLDHKVIVVFASDGDPTSCTITSIPQIAALASSAYNYNGVQTYVIAMAGATVSALNQIAAAGGTNQAYDVTSNPQQFSQKMQEIQSSALSCEFVLPPPPMGQALDPKLVNVNYTPGSTMVPGTLPQSDNLADCGVGPGWYYDDPINPTKIVLCPASCTTIKADSQAKIDVAFGCVTIPN